MPPAQPVFHGLGKQGIEHRSGGNSDENSGNAHESAAYDDRQQHPDSGQADGGTHHPGIDDISFKLLQKKQEHHKPQTVPGEAAPGSGNQQNKGAGKQADIRAQQGNQAAHADNGADEQGIGQADNAHAQITQHPQNQGFRQLARHKAGENPVGNGGNLDNPAAVLGGKESIQHPFQPPEQVLLLGQHIDGKDHAHDKGEHTGSDGGGNEYCCIVQVPHKVRSHLAGLTDDRRPVDIEQIDLCGINVQFIELSGNPGSHTAQIAGNVIGEFHQRLIQLRQHEEYHACEDGQHGQIGQDNTDRPPEPQP